MRVVPGCLIGGVLASLVLTGCSSSSTLTPTEPASRPPAATGSPPGPGTTLPGRPGRVVTAADGDDGHTVNLGAGDRLVVTLHNTYWTIAAPPDGGVLTLTGQPVVHGSPPAAPDCVPGGGCGTVTATFAARGPGRTDVTASRTTCGEARGCPGDEGRYRLTVVVR